MIKLDTNIDKRYRRILPNGIEHGHSILYNKNGFYYNPGYNMSLFKYVRGNWEKSIGRTNEQFSSTVSKLYVQYGRTGRRWINCNGLIISYFKRTGETTVYVQPPNNNRYQITIKMNSKFEMNKVMFRDRRCNICRYDDPAISGRCLQRRCISYIAQN